jgi:glycosyltransferase involved in cell wall biosynthesis
MVKCVVILTDNLLYGHPNITGSNIQTYNLAKGLVNHGYRIEIVYTGLKLKILPEEYTGIILIHCQISNKIILNILTLSRLFSILSKENPDIIYSRGRSILTYAASIWTIQNKKKHVWATNGEDSCEFWKRTSRLWKSEKSFFKKILLTIPSLLEDRYIHIGMRKCHIVLNQTEYQNLRCRQNLGKAGIIVPSIYLQPTLSNVEKQNIVLWMANLSPAKQPDIFIELAKKCRDYKDWKFILIGDTKNLLYKNKIIGLSRLLVNLEYKDKIPFNSSFDWYKKAKIFVGTSKLEADGLPNSFIQAWMNGAAVISLNHDPNNWFSQNQMGFHAGGNLELLTLTCRKWLSDPQLTDEIRSNAYRFSLSYFNPHKTIEKYMKYF